MRWKGEEGRAEEAIVPVLDEETTACSFRLKVCLFQKWFLHRFLYYMLLKDLVDGVQYKFVKLCFFLSFAGSGGWGPIQGEHHSSGGGLRGL